MNPETPEELLQRWDAGQTIWSLELGGLGPGYEQAIQVAAIEFMRLAVAEKFDAADPKELNKRWSDLCDRALKPIDEKLGGLTGAQFGAAEWLAFKLYAGPAEFERLVKRRGEDDRLIQVSRAWPEAPSPS